MLKLKQFWQWLKGLWRKLWGSEPPPQPTPTPKPRPTLTDTEREDIFLGLLEEVERGASSGRLKGIIFSKGVDGEEWTDWLRRFGERLLETPGQHGELARRMVRLGECREEVPVVAAAIGRELLAAVDEREDVDVGAEEWFERGVQQFMEGDFRGAIASWNKALAIKPDFHEAWAIRGIALYQLGELSEAIASYDKALEIKPDDHYAWFSQGLALSELGELSEAIASWDKALAIKPDDHEAWYSRGNALYDLGKFSEAIASYDKALAIKSDDHQAWYNRGLALGHLGELSEEIASYDEVLAIKPDYHKAWYNRGNALKDLGELSEAIASYDKALEIKPDDHEAWFNRGLAQENLGKLSEAIASYDKALEIKPDYHQAWHNRGCALGNLGEALKAIASFDKVLEIKPDFHQAWYSRGLELNNLGESLEAIASYDKALAIKPDFHEAWNGRGIALANLGELSEAIASYDKALVIKPDFQVALLNKGIALANSRERLEAIAYFEKALEIKPDFYQGWYSRGLELNNLGKLSEAIASFDKALAIKPDFHQAWKNRGIAVGKAVSYNPIAAEILQARFPNSPPVTINPQLTRCGYEGELLCYEEGLKYCPAETHPEGYGMLHRETGQAHYSQGKNNYRQRRSLYAKAVSSYNVALSTLTEKAYPQFHLETLRDLIKALLGLGQVAEAQQLRRDGTDLLRRLVADEKRSQESKQRLALKFADFQQLTVDIFVQSGQGREAWEAAEAGKNACLSWLLYALADELPECSYAGVGRLLREDRAIVYWHLSPIALTTFVLKYGEEGPVVVSSPSLRTQRQPPTPSLRTQRQRSEAISEIATGASTDTTDELTDASPLAMTEESVSLRTQRQRSEAISEIATGASTDTTDELTDASPLAMTEENERLIQFEEWLEKWNQLYGDYREGKKEEKTAATWVDELPEMLRRLKIILDIEAIETAVGEAKELILIPHRDLHRLPLHSLFGDGFVISCLPSVGMWLAADVVADELVAGEEVANQPIAEAITTNEPYTTLLSVENPKSISDFADKPLPKLPAAELESEYICRLLPNHKRLAREEVRQQRVEAELSKGRDIFHFSGHGQYNSQQPRKSALYLTAKERLRVENIVNLNLEACRLVCLSACETAVTGSETISAEYVGLVSAFLSRGVGRVVSTLWTVRSDAAALITIQFYRLFLLENIPPIEALNLATRWLRDLTYGDLVKWYEMLINELPKDEAVMVPFLDNRLFEVQRKEATERVYENPYFWAAFVISGS